MQACGQLLGSVGGASQPSWCHPSGGDGFEREGSGHVAGKPAIELSGHGHSMGKPDLDGGTTLSRNRVVRPPFVACLPVWGWRRLRVEPQIWDGGLSPDDKLAQGRMTRRSNVRS